MGVRWDFLGICREFIIKDRLLLENFTMSLTLKIFLRKGLSEGITKASFFLI